MAPTTRRRGSEAKEGGAAKGTRTAAAAARRRGGSPAECAGARLPQLREEEIHRATTIACPSLSFSLAEGKAHLIRADARFGRLLERVSLGVFEEQRAAEGRAEERCGERRGRGRDLDLFRTLVTSIVGQQVSWLAARAILYRFTRLWFPALPPTPNFHLTPRDSLPFPSPLQVRSASEGSLRSAGLSAQKVRYVTDVAERFSDGRLDVRKVVEMSEGEVVQEMVKIKGVGLWTAQMLLLFALRRPNILPVGDLGVQRGMLLLWSSGPEGPPVARRKPLRASAADTDCGPDVVDGAPLKQAQNAHQVQDTVETAAAAAAAKPRPLPTTPQPQPLPQTLPSLPAEAKLSPGQLMARRRGEKAKGNVYLTPQEMEALAKSWEPYRSLASLVMWALVDT